MVATKQQRIWTERYRVAHFCLPHHSADKAQVTDAGDRFIAD
jgi:hypothetical protein